MRGFGDLIAWRQEGRGAAPAFVWIQPEATQQSSSRKKLTLPSLPSRGYGATAARLTPDQKVGSSSLSGLIWLGLKRPGPIMRIFYYTTLRLHAPATYIFDLVRPCQLVC